MSVLMNDYLLQSRLKAGAPELHRRVSACGSVLSNMLFGFRSRFPGFTDHSLLHSMNVLYYCNQLIGPGQIGRLCPEECYILIMACYLHDIGMCIGEADYLQFSKLLPSSGASGDVAERIRVWHHELSGMLIRKYAGVFEIPSEALLYGVIQVSRGHRKTDLLDPEEYPDLPVEGGVARLAYLAAIMRLADDIDVGADRNSALLSDTVHATRRQDIEAHGAHESIRGVELDEKRILLRVRPKSPEYVPLLRALAGKIQQTLDYCREAAGKRSDLRITQESVVLTPETAGLGQIGHAALEPLGRIREEG